MLEECSHAHAIRPFAKDRTQAIALVEHVCPHRGDEGAARAEVGRCRDNARVEKLCGKTGALFEKAILNAFGAGVVSQVERQSANLV